MGQTLEVCIQTSPRLRRSTCTALRPAAPLAAATLVGLFHGARLLALLIIVLLLAAALLLTGLLLAAAAALLPTLAALLLIASVRHHFNSFDRPTITRHSGRKFPTCSRV